MATTNNSSGNATTPYVITALPATTKKSSPELLQGSQNTEEDEVQICTTTEYTWSAGDEECIILSPAPEVAVPGNILLAGSLQSGAFQIVRGDRYPLTISCPEPIFDIDRITIERPTSDSINEAVGKMIKSLNGVKPSANITWSCTEILSEKHLGFQFRAKYSSPTFNLSGAFNFANSLIRTRYVAEFTQIYYTLVATVPPRDKTFVSKPLDVDQYSPVIISSVRYGRKILISLESEEEHKITTVELAAGFRTLAARGDFSADAHFEDFYKSTNKKISIIGGSAGDAGAIWAAMDNSPQDLITEIRKGMEVSLNSLGAPMAFTVKNISDGSVFAMVDAGTFPARSCVVKPKNTYEIALISSFKHNTLYLRPEQGHESAPLSVFRGTGDISVTKNGNEFIIQWKLSNSGDRTRTIAIETTLKSLEYLLQVNNTDISNHLDQGSIHYQISSAKGRDIDTSGSYRRIELTF